MEATLITMNLAKSRVLIGPITRDPSESVGMINEALMAGLDHDFEFVPHIATRRAGFSRLGAINCSNLWCFVRHLASWMKVLICQRPSIAHYAITSNWNMEKSLLFLWFAQIAGIRTVGHLHGGRFIDFWSRLSPIRHAMAMHVIERLDAFVVLSDGWKKRVVRDMGIVAERVHVVNNPLDAEFEETVIGFKLRRTGSTVLCFGVMGRMKGVLDILTAAAALPADCNAKFLLVGPEREPGIGDEVQRIIEASAVQERVRWIGPVHGDLKISLFREAALFLLPSYVENFPVTIIEAIAAGVPVICTPVGASPEFLVDRESVWFVHPGAPEEISTAVSTLLKSEDERLRLATTARQVFGERLQRTSILAQMKSAYLRALA